MRILLAFRVFFLTLFSSGAASRVRQALMPPEAVGPAPSEAPPKLKEPARPKAAVRSEAVALLAALQREARLVDLIQEPLAGYTDAQIGAVARDVLRDSAKVLERLFALAPVAPGEEGSEVEVPRGFDAGRFQLTGNVTGEPPFRGQLVHHGWEAARCDLPAWSGSEAAARVVAPAEVELK